MRVPEHCSVIGFDDVAASALCTPSAHHRAQPMEAMGAGAVDIVIEGIKSVLEKREVGAHHRKVARGISSPGLDPESSVRRNRTPERDKLARSKLDKTLFFLDIGWPENALFIRFNNRLGLSAGWLKAGPFEPTLGNRVRRNAVLRA